MISKEFMQRVARVEAFAADPYWRVEVFGREIVERELGYVLPRRVNKFRVQVGEYQSIYTSELDLHALPRRINSVPVTSEMAVTRIEAEKPEMVLE